jgi:hypothetical protein
VFPLPFSLPLLCSALLCSPISISFSPQHTYISLVLIDRSWHLGYTQRHAARKRITRIQHTALAHGNGTT